MELYYNIFTEIESKELSLWKEAFISYISHTSLSLLLMNIVRYMRLIRQEILSDCDGILLVL